MLTSQAGPAGLRASLPGGAGVPERMLSHGAQGSASK